MNQLIKLVLLGDSGTGKTSIAQRYTTNEYNEESKTNLAPILFSKLSELPSGQNIKMLISDKPGIEKCKSLSLVCCLEASAAILVYDITQIKSFSSIIYWLNHIKKPNMLIAIVANKSDLIGEKNEMNLALGRKLTEENNAIFKYVSAKKCGNCRTV
jgi:small GTP-binding protein